MSNWGFFKGSFWKKSLTSFKIVPELGLFNAIFGEKKILPDQFWQFWKNPLQVQVFKKKVSNFKAVLVELRFCSSSFPAQFFPRKIVELGIFQGSMFRKKKRFKVVLKLGALQAIFSPENVALGFLKATFIRKTG